MTAFLKWRPGPKDVAKRFMALTIVFQRGSLEDVEEIGGTDDRERQRVEMLRWSSDVGLFESLSNIEKHRLQTPVGSLGHQHRIDSAWRLESVGTLAWAMELREMVPYDVQLPMPEWSFIPFHSPKDAVQAFIGVMRLRRREEIDREREIAELWHWRSRTAELEKAGVPPPKEPGMDFKQIVSRSAEIAHTEGLIPETKGDDFPAFDKPYHELDDDQLAFVTSVAIERHWALNWLCGYSKDWDRVPTDT